MARAKFKCAGCGRKFSMAAHLARHKSAKHGLKSKRKKTVRSRASKAGKRGAAGRRRAVGVRGAGAAAGGAAHLIGEIQTYYGELTSRRAALDAQIAAVVTALGAMGEAGGASPGRPSARKVGRRVMRGGNGRLGSGVSLKAFIARSLRKSSKPLGPTEIASAVLKAGYKTTSKNFVRRVSNALLGLKGLRKAGRGKYTM